VDICQSVGQLPLNVQNIHCDFATTTARKFLRGPRGIGFMYISDKVLTAGFEPMFLDMRGADWVSEKSYRIKPTATRYEDWEFSYSNILGMGAAVEYMLEIGVENIEKRNHALCVYLIEKLKNIKGIKVVDSAPKLSSIVIVAFEKHSPWEIKNQLLAQHINTSIASRSSALIDFTKKDIVDALRISPHYYNTEEEIDVLIAALKKSI
jgi:selenocysteine lyase/cysteine desulfurase